MIKVKIIKSDNQYFNCYKCKSTKFELKYLKSYDTPIENRLRLQNLIVMNVCLNCKTKNAIPSNKIKEIKFLSVV